MLVDHVFVLLYSENIIFFIDHYCADVSNKHCLLPFSLSLRKINSEMCSYGTLTVARPEKSNSEYRDWNARIFNPNNISYRDGTAFNLLSSFAK